MPDLCEQLFNPVTGQSIIIRKTAAETGGQCLTLESVWAGPTRKPPLHYHPSQEERFRVLEGELAVTVGGTARTLRAGDTLTIAAGEPHEMSPAGVGQARAVWETRPALRSEEMMRTVFALAEDGKVDRHGLPRALRLVAIGHEYSQEIRLNRPPWPIQRRILAILAPLARVWGCHAVYQRRAGSSSRVTSPTQRTADAG
jgi:mannose-6-phosphate isomerase-like protein (cupin superfamily)